MKTLRRVGILLMSVCMVAGFTACSDDDDDKGGGGNAGNGVLKVGNITRQLNYCYIYNSNDGELLFTDFYFRVTSAPARMNELNVDFENHINTITQATLGPDEYSLEFRQDTDPRTEKTAATYDWGSAPAFLNAKTPGNLKITRNGNNITVKIDNLWVYGGNGMTGWSSYQLPEGFQWLSGSFSYTGPMTDLSAYMGED